MWIVTIQAFLFDFVGIVLGLGLMNVVLLVSMTTEAQGRHRVIQAHRVGRGMRIMTI